jgi:hypothetical protein
MYTNIKILRAYETMEETNPPDELKQIATEFKAA